MGYREREKGRRCDGKKAEGGRQIWTTYSSEWEFLTCFCSLLCMMCLDAIDDNLYSPYNGGKKQNKQNNLTKS